MASYVVALSVDSGIDIDDEVRAATQKFFDCDLALHPCDRSSDAVMRAVAETQMLFDLALDVALFCIGSEFTVVAICSRVAE